MAGRPVAVDRMFEMLRIFPVQRITDFASPCFSLSLNLREPFALLGGLTAPLKE